MAQQAKKEANDKEKNDKLLHQLVEDAMKISISFMFPLVRELIRLNEVSRK
jgi:hypothetical protein